MASASARKDRGRQTELIGAKYYRERLWPDCKAVPASHPGRDLHNTPGAAIEIKARSKFSPVAWVRQAEKNAGEDTPLVLMRPIGYGAESVDDWLIFMRNRDFVSLWKEAHGGGGSRRTSRRASRQKGKEDSGGSYSLRVGSQSHLARNEILETTLSTLLYGLGFEPGDYEMEIRRVPSGSHST